MNAHGRLRVEVFTDPIFQENGLLVWTDAGTDCWIVDPGFPPQPDEIAAAIARHGLTPAAILLTHCHPDHIAGVRPLRERFESTPVIAPADEAAMLTDPDANLSSHMGFPITAVAPDRLLRPGERLQLGGLDWQVLDVCGHSPGGLAFHCPDAGVVIAGDALFAGSIGRHDFPGSSGERLLRNIRDNLLSLPESTVVYSGHGPSTTIGRERQTNPFLAGIRG